MVLTRVCWVGREFGRWFLTKGGGNRRFSQHGWGWVEITLPKTNSHFAPEKWPKPKRKRESIPTILFQVRTVSFREGIQKDHPSKFESGETLESKYFKKYHLLDDLNSFLFGVRRQFRHDMKKQRSMLLQQHRPRVPQHLHWKLQRSRIFSGRRQTKGSETSSHNKEFGWQNFDGNVAL